MNHVVRFWSMHPRHTERAVMGDTHGNTASSHSLGSWESPSWKGRRSVEVLIVSWLTWGLQPLPWCKSPMSSPPVCKTVLQPVMGNASGTKWGKDSGAKMQRGTWTAFLWWDLLRRESRPKCLAAASPIAQGAPHQQIKGFTDQLHLVLEKEERREEGVLSAAGECGGDSSGGRLARRMHNLWGGCASP